MLCHQRYQKLKAFHAVFIFAPYFQVSFLWFSTLVGLREKYSESCPKYLHTMSYLKVFDVWEGNSNGYHCPGIIVCEVKTFTHFASAHSNEKCTIYNTKTTFSIQNREWQVIYCRTRETNNTLSVENDDDVSICVAVDTSSDAVVLLALLHYTKELFANLTVSSMEAKRVKWE